MAQRKVLAVGRKTFVDLNSQLTCWGKDERTNVLRAFGHVLRKQLQHRDGESRCFAGAGLGAAEDVSLV